MDRNNNRHVSNVKQDQKLEKDRRFGRKKTVSDEDRLKKNIDFFSWVQEFSKKIVAITFLIFVLPICLLYLRFSWSSDKP